MYCESCSVDVLSGQQRCPLCHARIAEEPQKNEYYPEYPPFAPAPYRFWFRFSMFCSLAACVLCGVINLMVGGYPWALLVLISVAFAWGIYFFSSRKKHWVHVIIHYTLLVSILMGLIDVLDKSPTWSLNYVIPFFLMGSALLITLMVIARPLKLQDYMIHQISVASFGIILVILAVTGAVNPTWPCYACATYDGLTFLGMAIFGDRTMRTELKKRFHF